MRNARILGIVIMTVALMLAGGMVLNRRAASTGLDRVGAEVKGKPAPRFELKTLDGKTVRLEDLRGKAVLLNFWATWCAPCKIEMPWFIDFQEKYRDQGLVVLGVVMDEAGDPEVKKFAEDMKLNYPVLRGNDDVGEVYGGVQFLPTTFYIDRNGKMVDRHFGLNSRSKIEDRIKEALATQ